MDINGYLRIPMNMYAYTWISMHTHRDPEDRPLPLAVDQIFKRGSLESMLPFCGLLTICTLKQQIQIFKAENRQPLGPLSRSYRCQHAFQHGFAIWYCHCHTTMALPCGFAMCLCDVTLILMIQLLDTRIWSSDIRFIHRGQEYGIMTKDQPWQQK